MRSRQPGTFDPRFADDLAALLTAGGHPAAAIAVLDSARLAFPEVTGIRETLGRACLEPGRFDRAAEVFLELASRAGNDVCGLFEVAPATEKIESRASGSPRARSDRRGSNIEVRRRLYPAACRLRTVAPTVRAAATSTRFFTMYCPSSVRP